MPEPPVGADAACFKVLRETASRTWSCERANRPFAKVLAHAASGPLHMCASPAKGVASSEGTPKDNPHELARNQNMSAEACMLPIAKRTVRGDVVPDGMWLQPTTSRMATNGMAN
mmetsp:Transcript_50638/g.127569  ORF Transcript_50638/g.127569 Transcript_50638/m.127569 type:complete len:115 (-) Transcript_50638:27-371(-)